MFIYRIVQRQFLNLRIQNRFGNYRKFAQVVLEISQIGSHIDKKKIFHSFMQQNDIKSQQQNKPKTGIAEKTICQNLINNFNLQGCPNNIQNVADSLWDQLHKQKYEFVQQPDKQSMIDFDDVTNLLKSLTTIQGKKSKQRKLKLINQLILKANSYQQVKVLLRIIAKNLRMGAKDKMIQFNKNQVSNSIQSQNQSNSYRFQPMLAKPLKTMSDLQKFCIKKQCKKLIADLKYDGERSLITFKRNQPIQMISRRNKSQLESYKPLAQLIYKQLMEVQGLQEIKLDGQIVCVKLNNQPLPMQRLLNLRGKDYLQTEQQKQLYYAFDILSYNGQDLLNIQLQKRLEKIFQTSVIKKSISKAINYPEEKQQLIDFYMQTIDKNYQGLMIKGSTDKYYTNGSRRHWGKLKKGCKIQGKDTQQIDLDLVVMGIYTGKGKRSEFYGGFLLGVFYQGSYHAISRVGSGFTDQNLQLIKQIFKDKLVQNEPENYVINKLIKPNFYVKPQLVFEVKCQDITRSSIYNFSFKQGYGGLSLRFPVFQRIRDDKAPEECGGDILIGLSDN